MIKIITLLTSLILSTTVFCQDSLKSYQFFIGVKENGEDSLKWIKESISCEIFIDVNDDEIKIHSSEIQEYDIINCEIDFIGVSPNDSKIVNRFSTFLVSDKNGFKCHCLVGRTNNIITFIMVEYPDYAWVYLIKEN